MKTRNIFWGTFLLSLGLFFLLSNLELLEFDFSFVWEFWPLLIIFLGIAVIVKNIILRSILKALAALLLSLFIFGAVKSIYDGVNFFIENDDDHHVLQIFDKPFDDRIKEAELNIDAAIGTFIIDKTTDSLIHCQYSKNFGEYYIDVNDNFEEGNSRIDLILPDDNLKINIKDKNYLKVDLNPIPVWNLNLEVAASSARLDLSQFKVKRLFVESGASALSLKFSSLIDSSFINLKSGVSAIRFFVPEESGFLINSDMSLSSHNFDEFRKISKGTYQSYNFDSSNAKLFINLDGGVSSVKIMRY